MKLYNYWRSSSSWRVRIALGLKGLSYEYVPVHLLQEGGQQNTPEYKKLNPRGEVPTLEVEEDGKTLYLPQSVSIMEYLEERYPTPALLPADLRTRAKVRQLVEIMNSGVQPLHNLVVLQYVAKTLNGDEKVWARHWIVRGLDALEIEAKSHGGSYLACDTLTLADVCLVPQLYTARRFGVALEAYPTLVRIESLCNGMKAFQEAHAEKQIDAQKV